MPAEQSLVVHLFVHVEGPGAAARYGRVRRVWDACRRDLGMDRPVDATALPRELPDAVEDLPASGGVAACGGHRGPPEVSQAIVRRHRDLLVLTAALSAPEGWAELERRWSAAAGDTSGWAVGEARLLLAYPPRDEWSPSLLARGVSAALPGRVLSGAVRRRRPQALLWELDGAPDDRALRRIVAMAPDAGDAPAALEHWLWNEHPSRPARFARYLAAAAKMRHQMRVHDATPPVPDTAIEEASAALDAGIEELHARRQRLLGLVSGPGSLTQRAIDLRESSRTVEIALANMQDEGAVFPDDLTVARWFGHRLDDAVAYLELDRERARDTLAALTARAEAAIQRDRERLQAREAELQEREAKRQDRQNKINLVQTALIGAVLMVLTAVQAFGYRFRLLPPSAVPALISLLGALTLCLATLTLSLLAAGAQRRYTWLGSLCGGLVASTAGWLATTLVVKKLTGHPAAPPLTWSVMGPLFVLGGLAMWRTIRVYRRRTGH